MTMHRIDLQLADAPADFPNAAALASWLERVMDIAVETPSEVCLRVVTPEEIRALNHQYRARDSVTNVLAFPNGVSDEEDLLLLGDVVVCANRVIEEAADQKKTVEAHLVHLLLHGILHLQGYDHSEDDQAARMETVEIQHMQQLGFENPYEAVA